MVCNFNHTKNHQNTAHEIFFKSGPLAILPMKSENKNYFSSSLIWSNDIKTSFNLKNINNSLRKEIIEEKLFNYVGRINNILEINFFDLSAHLNERFYEQRVVYLGDAAHSMHPIAGQGWNLGVRDVRNILDVIISNQRLGLDIGSELACKEYHNQSYYDAYLLYQVTDKLNSIFLKNRCLSKKIRNIGFNFIEKNNFLKENIAKYAMGI